LSRFRHSGSFSPQPVAKASDLLERIGFGQAKKVIGECGRRCPTERTDQRFIRNMIGNQAGAGEGDAQTKDCRIDQQAGIAETLSFVATRVVAADMAESAAPIRTAAVTLRRRIVKQRQIQQCLNGVNRPAFRKQSRTAHRKDAIRHQFRHGIARIYSAAEANRDVDTRSASSPRSRFAIVRVMSATAWSTPCAKA
jgi:hypothetical protein